MKIPEKLGYMYNREVFINQLLIIKYILFLFLFLYIINHLFLIYC